MHCYASIKIKLYVYILLLYKKHGALNILLMSKAYFSTLNRNVLSIGACYVNNVRQ